MKKLTPEKKKCIFIMYSKYSKGYILIIDRTVTQIESRDANFIYDEFLSGGEVESNLSSSRSTPFINQSQQPQTCRNMFENISHCCFEIKREAFIAASQYNSESRTVHKALSSPSKEERTKD